MNKRIRKKKNLLKKDIFYAVIFIDDEHGNEHIDKYIRINAKDKDEAFDILEDYIDKNYKDGAAISSVMENAKKFIKIN